MASLVQTLASFNYDTRWCLMWWNGVIRRRDYIMNLIIIQYLHDWCEYVRFGTPHTLREESSQTNIILQYKLLALILSAVCSVIQQSSYVLHFYYTAYDEKYDCKSITH